MKIMGINGASHAFTQNRLQQGGREKDKVAESLRRQIDNIKESIQSISDDKNMTPEAKMERRKELESQLTMLNKQLTQHSIDKQKESAEFSKSDSDKQAEANRLPANKDLNPNILKDTTGMQSIITAGNILQQVETEAATKAKMEGLSRVLKSEISLDKSRGVDTSSKEDKLAGIGVQINQVSSEIGNLLGKSNNVLEQEDNKKPSDEVSDPAGKKDENGVHSEDGEETVTSDKTKQKIGLYSSMREGSSDEEEKGQSIMNLFA